MTFDQSGSGLLKFTSPLLLSGYGASKTIILKGDTAGSGEIAGNIVDPHDRAGKATTAITKLGSGAWTLSGSNSYTGPTTVAKGTLSLASAGSLGDKTDVHVSDGATLALTFPGEMRIGRLYFGGKLQPAGTYSAGQRSQIHQGNRCSEKSVNRRRLRRPACRRRSSIRLYWCGNCRSISEMEAHSVCQKCLVPTSSIPRFPGALLLVATIGCLAVRAADTVPRQDE